MNKKAVTGTEALRWLLGIIIVVVIIYILFAPKQLFAQVKKSLFGLGAEIPEEEPPKAPTQDRVPPKLQNYFDTLVSKVRNSGPNTGGCILEIGEFPRASGLGIGFHKDNIQLEITSVRGITAPEKKEEIKGLEPCYIKDDKLNRFLFCLKNKIVCTDSYETGDFVLDKSSVIAPFLFKFDDNHLCVVYYLTSPAELCGTEYNILLEPCIRDIKNTYPNCGGTSKPQFNECEAIKYCYKEKAIPNARPDLDCLPSTPTAFFKTKEDCIKGSQCIKEFVKGDKLKSLKDCDDTNKAFNAESGKFIWVWPKYIG